ncbi:MAG: UDP-N-acetylmuramoyl-tripeptide--D-alanyl-D-alanine ligase [Chitinispirillaceae bacterium]|nr:UDP-N-acetylmuramoyl-tripeptide--D-alanyl-D-alanine ligase [Chitinispirillaceae bacterium]
MQKNNISLTIEKLRELCNSKDRVRKEISDMPANSICYDSRQIKKGDIFLAIKTDKNDGHNFVESAFEAGAIAAIVNKDANFTIKKEYEDRLIKVDDTIKAIQIAAHNYRKMLNIPIIGITGSNGKTTTRNLVSTVLRQRYKVGETYTNWNNHIGVPLTLLRFTGEEKIGVIEMGANHLGEIKVLSKIASPDISIITNIGYAHVGLFGSLANTTKAKFEITEGMHKRKGVLILNGDDRRLVAYSKNFYMSKHFFGYSKRCDIKAKIISIDRERGIEFLVDGKKYHLQIPARHFIYNILPAIYIGRLFVIDEDKIAEAIYSFKPVFMRGIIERKGDVNYILDCYNANPSSMEAALIYLNDIAKENRKVAILGEMLELGRYSNRLHKEVGKMAVKYNVNILIAVGPSSELIAKGAIEAGMGRENIIICKSAEDAIPFVKKIIQKDDFVLLKGSRGIALEKIYNQIES